MVIIIAFQVNADEAYPKDRVISSIGGLVAISPYNYKCGNYTVTMEVQLQHPSDWLKKPSAVKKLVKSIFAGCPSLGNLTLNVKYQDKYILPAESQTFRRIDTPSGKLKVSMAEYRNQRKQLKYQFKHGFYYSLPGDLIIGDLDDPAAAFKRVARTKGRYRNLSSYESGTVFLFYKYVVPGGISKIPDDERKPKYGIVFNAGKVTIFDSNGDIETVPIETYRSPQIEQGGECFRSSTIHSGACFLIVARGGYHPGRFYSLHLSVITERNMRYATRGEKKLHWTAMTVGFVEEASMEDAKVALNSSKKEQPSWKEEGRTMTKGMQNLLEALKSKKPLYIINAPYKSCKPLVYEETTRRTFFDGSYGTVEQIVELNAGFLGPESGRISIYKGRVPKINVSKRCHLTNGRVESFRSGQVQAVFIGNQLSPNGRDISVRYDENGVMRSIGPNAPTHTWEAAVQGNICLYGSVIVTTKGGYETNCELVCSEWVDDQDLTFTIALGKQRAEQIASKQFNGNCSK